MVTLRWPCPRIQFSVSGKGEDGSFWPRCFSPIRGGQTHFPACTDSAPGAGPHCGPEDEAFPEISAGVDVVWSGSLRRECVSSQSGPAWWCRRRSMASGASEGWRPCIKEIQYSLTSKLVVHSLSPENTNLSLTLNTYLWMNKKKKHSK